MARKAEALASRSTGVSGRHRTTFFSFSIKTELKFNHILASTATDDFPFTVTQNVNEINQTLARRSPKKPEIARFSNQFQLKTKRDSSGISSLTHGEEG